MKCELVHIESAGVGFGAIFQCIKTNFEREPRTIVGLAPMFSIDGIMKLSNPLTNLTIVYKNGTFHCNVSQFPIHVDLTTFQGNATINQRAKPAHFSLHQSLEFELPFPIQITLQELHLKKFLPNNKHLISTIKQLSLSFNSVVNDLLDEHSQKFVHVGVFMDGFQNDLIQLYNVKGALRFDPSKTTTIEKLSVSIDTVKITAGYSSIEWAYLFDRDDEHNTSPMILHTPFVNIDGFELSVVVEGKLLSTGADLNIQPFVGDAKTTMEHLKTYYSGVVKQRFPSLLSNAEFLGENIVENTFTKVGIAKFGSGAIGGGVGATVGVAALDGIKSAVAAGKKGRNADDNDGYKFGDFTRGLIRGGREASKRGAQMRGDTEYIPGDMTAGVIAGTAEYAGNNKSKLVKSAGSGTAAMVGLAVAGPLGFVAGSYLGGKAAGSMVRDDSKGKIMCFELLYSKSIINIRL